MQRGVTTKATHVIIPNPVFGMQADGESESKSFVSVKGKVVEDKKTCLC